MTKPSVSVYFNRSHTPLLGEGTLKQLVLDTVLLQLWKLDGHNMEVVFRQSVIRLVSHNA